MLKLNLETRSHHAAVDEDWLALLSPTTQRYDYVRQLISAYGLQAPIEAALAYTPRLHLALELRERTRAGLLAQDLLALGLKASTIATLPQCFPIAPFGNPVEALGWMYVTERSTLLHDSIRRYVVAQVPEAARACAFLSAYEGIATARWNDFGRVLDRVVTTEQALDELVAAAHAGFRCASEWSRGSVASYARGA